MVGLAKPAKNYRLFPPNRQNCQFSTKVVFYGELEGHPGMTRTKALAKKYVWWPGLDSNIEQSVQKCVPCQHQQPDIKQATPLQLWSWPFKPWVRLHIMDFAGQLQGKMILIVMDSH